MASDFSNILKEELATTLEQLLAKTTVIDGVAKATDEQYQDTQAVEVGVKFDFKALSTSWKLFIPTATGSKFEYFMLGGMGDLKDSLDDEVTDAVNEIVSNVCGSVTTSINAQGYEDLGSVKFESLGSQIVDSTAISSSENLFTFTLDMEGEKLLIIISFDTVILPFISEISGVEGVELPKAESSQPAQTSIAKNGSSSSGASADNFGLVSLLGEDAITNLKLLFDIRLKLSVRLGSKIFLLKDILQWDIGEIIELEQMVNEPLEVLVNGIKVGEGEAVIIEGKFGLKIKKIGSEQSRMMSIGLGK